MAILKETYPVLGMTCAACVRKIETVLEKTGGIKDNMSGSGERHGWSLLRTDCTFRGKNRFPPWEANE